MKFLLFLCAILAVSSKPYNASGKLFHGEVVHSLGMVKVMPMKEAQWDYARFAGEMPYNLPKVVNQAPIGCTEGVVTTPDGSVYECGKVELMSYLSNADLGTSEETSDMWGAEILVGADYYNLAIVGHSDGTSFIDITDAVNPVFLGFLDTFDCTTIPGILCTKNRIWRDIKIYGDNAYIVSENYGSGMDIVNLRDLVTGTPLVDAATHYTGFVRAHNIVLNEETGFIYVVGSNKCSGGLLIYDAKVPVAQWPTADETHVCWSSDGYTHDSQCVIYNGPDADHVGRELCFNYNEDSFAIVDVTDKDAMFQISESFYAGTQYTHQGWLTENHNFVLMGDELDEMVGTTPRENPGAPDNGALSRTLIWDVQDLDAPFWSNTFLSTKTVIDHNMYILNEVVYQSNYCGGLRVLKIGETTTPGGVVQLSEITEHAYFDLAPDCDGPVFSGSWSNFPYYFNHKDNDATHQVVGVTSIERGFYLVRVDLS